MILAIQIINILNLKIYNIMKFEIFAKKLLLEFPIYNPTSKFLDDINDENVNRNAVAYN